MNDFDFILDDCLTQITSGAASLEECLARHPEEAARLKPLLQTALRVRRFREINPRTAFKVQARKDLYTYMQAHPHQRAWAFPIMPRVLVSLVSLVLAFFVTGTAFAQSALPGQSLYSWKLSSEQIWRAVAPDPVAVDLSLADRRIDELTIVAADPTREAEALKGYQQVLARLKSEKNNKNSDRILPELESHKKKLSAAGVSIPDLDSLLSPPNQNPSISPLTTPIPEKEPTVAPSVLPVINPTTPVSTLIPTRKP